MNLDFHYYGTYVAAVLAGYSSDEAETIAHAAQYVDDNTLVRIDPNLLMGTTPTPTSQTTEELAALGGFIDDPSLVRTWTEAGNAASRRIWGCFHFLPGNFGKPSTWGPLPYKGARNFDKFTCKYTWHYDAEAEKQFQLLCLPDSATAEAMVNEVVKTPDSPSKLCRIGVTMHVLADTWAHSYYAGIPAWHLNDVGSTVLNAETNQLIEFLPTSATPPGWAFNSYTYLGHGRMGHLPDYQNLRYKYKPQWTDAPIYKDNPTFFTNAFFQMFFALCSIRNGTRFTVGRGMGNYSISGDIGERIMRIFAPGAISIPSPLVEGDSAYHSIMDQSCNQWLMAIDDLASRLHVDIRQPGVFDPGAWLSDARHAPDATKTPYFQFHVAARQHREFIESKLTEDDIYLSFDPPSHQLFATVQVGDSGFIGGSSLEKSFFPPFNSYHYPHVGDSAIPLLLVLPAAKPLRSGDVVKIRTTESLGEDCFLGAWMETCLYYYSKDYDISRQKWVIEKIGGQIGDPITPSDAIHIRNVHCTSQPFLGVHQATPWSSKYLTTSSDPTTIRIQFKFNPPFRLGSGTPADPYQIETAKDLDHVRHYASACYLQVADIDLATTSYAEGFEPIDNFTGSYDGGGYSISHPRAGKADLDAQEGMGTWIPWIHGTRVGDRSSGGTGCQQGGDVDRVGFVSEIGDHAGHGPSTIGSR